MAKFELQPMMVLHKDWKLSELSRLATWKPKARQRNFSPLKRVPGASLELVQRTRRKNANNNYQDPAYFRRSLWSEQSKKDLKLQRRRMQSVTRRSLALISTLSTSLEKAPLASATTACPDCASHEAGGDRRVTCRDGDFSHRRSPSVQRR
eukprot:scaffold131502_cov39-Prasinocladus_malaysianus.AAC.2